MPVLQSLSQARDHWSSHAASAIWDASIVKVILGGASASASKDLQELRTGLASDQPEIEVTLRLPRDSALKVLALLDAEQNTGAGPVPAEQEYTTTEAAKLLGMSRPTLMRMIERERTEFRMVGKHHRIPASSIQKLRQLIAEDHMAVVAGLANKYGNRG